MTHHYYLAASNSGRRPLLNVLGFSGFNIQFNVHKSNRKAMNRNWSNQKANPALKTKTGNK